MIHFLELQDRIVEEILNAFKNRDQTQFNLENVLEETNKSKLSQNSLQFQANYGATDQMEKARLEHQINTLKSKEEAFRKIKEESDIIIRNEMNFWKTKKTVDLKSRFVDMSKKNMDLINSQLVEYEKLLNLVENL